MSDSNSGTVCRHCGKAIKPCWMKHDTAAQPCKGFVHDNNYHTCGDMQNHWLAEPAMAEHPRFTEIREGVYEPTTVSNNKVDDARVTEIINHRFSHNHSAGSDYCPACMASSVAEQPRQMKDLLGRQHRETASCETSKCKPVAASPVERPPHEYGWCQTQRDNDLCSYCEAHPPVAASPAEGPRPDISCLLCGHIKDKAVVHQPSGQYVCFDCRDAATRGAVQPVPGAKVEGLLPEMPQEYGQEHPWKAFDEWHKQHHEGKYSWPCAHPLRCLWRYTRKTGALLNQRGNVAQTIPLPKAKVEEIAAAIVKAILAAMKPNETLPLGTIEIAAILRPYFPADAPQSIHNFKPEDYVGSKEAPQPVIFDPHHKGEATQHFEMKPEIAAKGKFISAPIDYYLEYQKVVADCVRVKEAWERAEAERLVAEAQLKTAREALEYIKYRLQLGDADTIRDSFARAEATLSGTAQSSDSRPESNWPPCPQCHEPHIPLANCGRETKEKPE